jgi:hypothetical protein
VPVNFARRPLWLVKGVDRSGRNDFRIGHLETEWKLSHDPLALVISVSLVAAAAPDAPSAPDSEAADLVLYNGKVVTVDGSFSIARAVAIRASDRRGGRRRARSGHSPGQRRSRSTSRAHA